MKIYLLGDTSKEVDVLEKDVLEKEDICPYVGKKQFDPDAVRYCSGGGTCAVFRIYKTCPNLESCKRGGGR